MSPLPVPTRVPVPKMAPMTTPGAPQEGRANVPLFLPTQASISGRPLTKAISEKRHPLAGEKRRNISYVAPTPEPTIDGAAYWRMYDQIHATPTPEEAPADNGFNDPSKASTPQEYVSGLANEVQNASDTQTLESIRSSCQQGIDDIDNSPSWQVRGNHKLRIFSAALGVIADAAEKKEEILDGMAITPADPNGSMAEMGVESRLGAAEQLVNPSPPRTYDSTAPQGPYNPYANGQ